MMLSPEQATIMEQILTDGGAVGITYADAKENPIYEPLPGQMPLWDFVKLTALFDNQATFTSLHSQLEAQFPEYEMIATRLKSQIWERAWLTHFKPMKFGQNSWIIPSGFKPPDNNAVNLYLDPGLAFGTGTHPTTALCLEWLDANDVSGLHLVDFGCGSGVLAIMALLHGAARVSCVDIDPQAIAATAVNAEKNGVAERIDFIEPNQIERIVNQDGVIANILAKPLLELSETFHKMLKNKGFIVLSGILKEQFSSIEEKYSEYFIDINHQFEQEWCRVTAVFK